MHREGARLFLKSSFQGYQNAILGADIEMMTMRTEAEKLFSHSTRRITHPDF
jgi:hypothetical protein